MTRTGIQTFAVVAVAVAIVTLASACRDRTQDVPPRAAQTLEVDAVTTPPPTAPAGADPHVDRRRRMVRDQIQARGVEDPNVLEAMRAVPRHAFVPDHLHEEAYRDYPLPIGEEQTISQPYIVARMTELAQLEPGKSKVLEVGTGSGYQAAVLAQMEVETYSIEIVPELAAGAKAALERAGYTRGLHLREGDGYAGWIEAAPFDAIIVTAAPPEIPKPLRDQLAVGGRMVIPVGDAHQELMVITRTGTDTYERRSVLPVRFVPMTGKAQDVDGGSSPTAP